MLKRWRFSFFIFYFNSTTTTNENIYKYFFHISSEIPKRKKYNKERMSEWVGSERSHYNKKPIMGFILLFFFFFGKKLFILVFSWCIMVVSSSGEPLVIMLYIEKMSSITYTPELKETKKLSFDYYYGLCLVPC